jgi:hypothetical protein
MEEEGLKEIPVDAVVLDLGQLDQQRLFRATGPAHRAP